MCAIWIISIHVPLTRDDNSSLVMLPPPQNFNPRPSYEGRPLRLPNTLPLLEFQSTSLLRGTTCPYNSDLTAQLFQSTSLLRGTTIEAFRFYSNIKISIHVPLTRDDKVRNSISGVKWYFNPRPSYEGRRAFRYASRACDKFQSTSLLRGTTIGCASAGDCFSISIHVPLTRDDY